MMKGFPWALVTDLRCPYCGSRFETSLKLAASHDGLLDGILSCDCYRYPVVQGIPVIRHIGPVSSTQNVAVERLLQGDAAGALQWLLSIGSAVGVARTNELSNKNRTVIRLTRKLRHLFSGNFTQTPRSTGSPDDTFATVLYANRPRAYADYLFHRFANPSFLGAIPALVVLGDACRLGPRRRLLDLSCGVGHSSATLLALCPGIEIVMADIDFVNLFIARRFLAPDAAALCIDAELPLPFSDESLDAVLCIDGFHYVRSKVALLRELDRAISPDGAWVFAHLHNAAGTNVNPGAPLDANGYMQRFAFGHRRLLPESQILQSLQHQDCLDLTSEVSGDTLQTSNALTLVGARSDRLWVRHANLSQALFRRPDLLAINPVYRVEENDEEGLVAKATWPSDSLHRECGGTEPLIRETVQLSYQTPQDLAAASEGKTLSGDLRELMRTFVVVPLPKCYPRTTSSIMGSLPIT